VTVRVLLVDDPGPAREVAGLLAAQDGVEVVGSAASAAEARTAVDRRPVDVALLATTLPDVDGLALCRELRTRAPELRCLLLTVRADDDALFDAVVAGASGLADRRGADLLEAVRIVGSGGSLLDDRTTAALLARLRRQRDTDDPLGRLTAQERAVLDLIGEGLPNRQISVALQLADKVVKGHVSHLLGKLGLQRRTQLVELAARLRANGDPSPG
jgi:DNA-binding NarL/FixJ family response regulator